LVLLARNANLQPPPNVDAWAPVTARLLGLPAAAASFPSRAVAAAQLLGPYPLVALLLVTVQVGCCVQLSIGAVRSAVEWMVCLDSLPAGDVARRSYRA
jgi:hypothetical protein